MKLVEAFVDGGCSPNPGPGAYAAILDYKGHIKEFVKDDVGTNNQMEMKAAILALDALQERCEIHIYTDSQYLYKGMTMWFRQWRGNGWRNTNNDPVSNLNLWRQLDALCRRHEVHWHWIRGHNGVPYHDRAHQLCQDRMATRITNKVPDRVQRRQEEHARRQEYRKTLQKGH